MLSHKISGTWIGGPREIEKGEKKEKGRRKKGEGKKEEGRGEEDYFICLINTRVCLYRIFTMLCRYGTVYKSPRLGA